MPHIVSQSRRLMVVLIVLVISSMVIASSEFVHAQTSIHTTQPLNRSGDDNTDDLALANTIVPARDRIDLAQRLMGVTDIPAPPSTPEREFETGDVETFFIQGDSTGVADLEATLIYKNDHVYMWVETGYSVDVDLIKKNADDFSEIIYERTREIFGSENSPGIDGDPRLHVLNAADLGAGTAAYFYSESAYPREAVAASNEKEIFFVNLDNMRRAIGSDYYTGVLAHEFQHMIHWKQDANETSWMNEGLSELAAFINGYGISDFTDNYLANPDQQMTYGREVIYGAGFLFTAYILDHYGEDAIRTLVADPANGMDSVDDVLIALGINDPISGEQLSAKQLFATFSIANYLNDTTIDAGQYGYSDVALQRLPKATTSQTFDSPTDFTLSNTFLEQWATKYYRVRGLADDQTYKLSFAGNETVNLVPANPYSGRYAYWSNRVDDSDTRLTREIDLTTVDSATLSFRTWYDIETDWDYAYVMVSGDDGQSWDLLESPRTTTRNPHQNSYGNAYTGQSGDWVEESFDLSAYAGQSVLLRFEYITDDATIENGFLLDDVSIPEINFFDDFEQDSGWEAEGWVRIQNVVSQSFSLQMITIEPDKTVTVERLLTPVETPFGEWEIAPQQNGETVIFVVSAFASVTSERATIDLNLSPAN